MVTGGIKRDSCLSHSLSKVNYILWKVTLQGSKLWRPLERWKVGHGEERHKEKG